MGIKPIGLAVECDRCKKSVALDAKEEKAYTKYAQVVEGSGDEKRMFMCVFEFDKVIDVEYEFLCPRCRDAIRAAVEKVTAPAKKKTRGKKKDPVTAAKKGGKKTEVAAAKASVDEPTATEPEPGPEPDPETPSVTDVAPGADDSFGDEDYF